MIDVEHVDFLGVATQDLERAKAFYGETLGLPLEKDYGDNGAEYRAGQVTVGVWDHEVIGMEFTPNLMAFALRVPDVAEARKALEADGVQFNGETFDTGVCHIASFNDPDGNHISLHRRYAP